MTTNLQEQAQSAERRDALVERLFQATLGFFDLISVYLGDRLGLYAALAAAGPITSDELAERTATDARYMREWLEQQAATGILHVDQTGTSQEWRYSLPTGHDEVLLDRDSLSYMAGSVRVTLGATSALPRLLQAYQTGGGIPYAAFGADTREGIAESNRPMFLNLLGSHWFPAIHDVHLRLQSDPPAHVADIGCGLGWSSISIARAYPNARIDGFDMDDASIVSATENAVAAGVADRVQFRQHDVADPEIAGQYDVVTAFETIHDMARPVEALAAMRKLLAPGGCVIVADERVGETFTAPSDEMDRFCYGWSILHCLPASRAESPSAATGTVMRPATLRQYASEAGFREFEVLPIENESWRLYRLVP